MLGDLQFEEDNVFSVNVGFQYGLNTDACINYNQIFVVVVVVSCMLLFVRYLREKGSHCLPYNVERQER